MRSAPALAGMTPAPGERRLTYADAGALECFTADELARACEAGAIEQLDAGSCYLLDAFAATPLPGGGRLLGQVLLSPARTAAGIPTATWNTPAARAHAMASAHLEGQAFDVMPRAALGVAWLTAVRDPRWTGIGAYPYWRPRPGLHLDTKPRYSRTFWLADPAGRYTYLQTPAEITRALEAILAATLAHAAGDRE